MNGAKVRTVETWDELADVLQEYKSIDRLVFFFHGIPGALLVGGDGDDLSDVGNKHFKGKKVPKVGQLDLEGCSVAENIEKIVPFGKLFNAEKMTAWNNYHVGAPVTVKVPDGATAATVEASLKKYKGYLLENIPSYAEMARKPGTYEIEAEWFRQDLNDDPLPDPTSSGLDPREKTFMKRDKKSEVTLSSMEEVKAYSEKYQDAPIQPLDHVTINLSGMK